MLSNRNEPTASITILVSLVFMIITSLLLTIVESARISVARAISDNQMYLAGNNRLADYDQTLFDCYHIFAILPDKLDKCEVKKELERQISSDTNLVSADAKYDLVKIKEYSISTSNVRTLVEDNYKEYINQAIEYMGYKSLVQIPKIVLKKFKIINDQKQVFSLIKKKAALEGKMSNCESLMRELCEQIDGIHFEYGQLARTQDGSLVINKRFAKRVIVGEISKEAVGINNDFVFECIKGSYIDMKNLYMELEQGLKKLSSDFVRGNEDSEKLYDRCQEILYIIEETSNETIQDIDTSIALINKIKNDSDSIEIELENFSRSLNSSKDSLEQEIYDNFVSEKDELIKSPLANMRDIRKQLKANRRVLIKLSEIPSIGYGHDKKMLENAYKNVKRFRKYLDYYHIENITFDYSQLKKEEGTQKKINRGLIVELIDEGITAFCIDNFWGLSRNVMLNTALPSSAIRDAQKDVNLSESIRKMFSGGLSNLGSDIELVMGNLLDGEFSEAITTLSNNEIMKRAMFVEYLSNHFNSYVNDKDSNQVKHCLVYEQEYIVCGNRSDMANIKRIIEQIMIIRFATNFLAISLDPSKRTQAFSLALSTTGYIVVPVITYLVQILVECAWAYEESLVDCIAIMQGYKVPLIKMSSDVIVQLPVVFTFNRTIAKALAMKYRNRTGSLDFSYEDYLWIFLMSKNQDVIVARSLDIIQSNLELTEKRKLNMERSLCGFGVNVHIEMDSMYITSANRSYSYDKKYSFGY